MALKTVTAISAFNPTGGPGDPSGYVSLPDCTELVSASIHFLVTVTSLPADGNLAQLSLALVEIDPTDSGVSISNPSYPSTFVQFQTTSPSMTLHQNIVADVLPGTTYQIQWTPEGSAGDISDYGMTVTPTFIGQTAISVSVSVD